jgi:hypothetical protein
MRLKTLYVILFISNALIAQQKGATEIKVPDWVHSKPIGSDKYVGIGVAEKDKSADYQLEAKKNALYDLASEIKVDISTNSILFTVQNNNQFDQNFNSLIQLNNTDNIEGYNLVDTYENDKQYWVYYELDKADYQNRKAQKKQLIISKASNLIQLSFDDEQNKNTSAALKKRIQAFSILNPYLNEEIVFDATQTKGIKTVFDLTNLIQLQLQSINITSFASDPIIKPYQPIYTPINLPVIYKNAALNDFPFQLISDDDNITLEETAFTSSSGALPIKINYVQPVFQTSSISIIPDLKKLMENDSNSVNNIDLLKQFIQTPTLKTEVQTVPITIFISSAELNFDKPLSQTIVQNIVLQKFNSEEFNNVVDSKIADYSISLQSNTTIDISNDVLKQNYNLNLAALTVSIVLKNKANELLYSTTLSDVYGYANSPERAGINAYNNPKLVTELNETLFFLKRKIVNY